MAPHDGGGALQGVVNWPGFAKGVGEIPFADAIIARQRSNLETLYRANLAALSGAQAFVNRQFDIAREAVAEFSAMAQILLSPQGSANDYLAKQAQHSKEVIEKGVASVRELGEIVGSAQTEALEIINRHVMTGLDEVRDYWSGSPTQAAAE